VKCPKCPNEGTKVIESRDVAEGESIRRRRQCLSCDYRFTTYERVERPHLVVVKKDGTRQMFSRDKLYDGLQRATEKTSVTSMQLEELIARVEKHLYESGEPEVSSNEIGRLVMDELAQIDDVAYVRFASVYRQFKDLASFERELSRIKDR
jgi:transcriptional repressor NrdR